MLAPKVKVFLSEGAQIPKYQTLGSACQDVHACLPPDTNCIIPPFERLLIPTGLRFEIPESYFISVRPRSGLALRQGFNSTQCTRHYRIRIIVENLRY